MECLTIKEAKKQAYLDSWTEKFGNALNTTKLGLDFEFFELRPVNFEAFAGLDSSKKTMWCWARLATHLQGILFVKFE
jgi:hypothetical protein